MLLTHATSLLIALLLLTGKQYRDTITHNDPFVPPLNHLYEPGDTLPVFLTEKMQQDSTLLVARCQYRQEPWYALHKYSSKQISSSTSVIIQYYDSIGNPTATYQHTGGFTASAKMEPDTINKAAITYYIPDTIRILARKAGIKQIEICNYQHKILYLLRKADYRNSSRLTPLYTDSYYTGAGKTIASFQYHAQWNLPRKDRDKYLTVCVVPL